MREKEKKQQQEETHTRGETNTRQHTIQSQGKYNTRTIQSQWNTQVNHNEQDT